MSRLLPGEELPAKTTMMALENMPFPLTTPNIMVVKPYQSLECSYVGDTQRDSAHEILCKTHASNEAGWRPFLLKLHNIRNLVKLR